MKSGTLSAGIRCCSDKFDRFIKPPTMSGVLNSAARVLKNCVRNLGTKAASSLSIFFTISTRKLRCSDFSDAKIGAKIKMKLIVRSLS